MTNIKYNDSALSELVSRLQLAYTGYACIPYLHNHLSIEFKEIFEKSKNVTDLFFATATFSPESKLYFSDSTNHYLIVKFHDSQWIETVLEKSNHKNTVFIFNISEELFERESVGDMNFISFYFLEYGESGQDYFDIANVVGRREKVAKAGLGNMKTISKNPPKFTFPYSDNIVALEVCSEKSHQSVNKYCEKTRRDVNRKGLTMTNLMGLSILEKLK